MSSYVPKIGSLSGYWIPVGSVFLILSPLPLGLRTAELSFVALCGVAIAVANGSIGTGKLKIVGWFLLLTCFGTALNVLRGEPFSIFQFFRGATFSLIGLWLSLEEIHDRFFALLDRMIPTLILGGFVAALLYFGFGLDYYNSQVDLPFETSESKRLYIYPSLLFVVLFIDAALSGRVTQVVYLAIIAITGSKTFFLVVAFTYLLNVARSRSLKRTAFSIVMPIMAVGIGLAVHLPDRIGALVDEGDPWRVVEPLAALDRLSDPLRLVFGDGAGVPYWGGRESVVDYDEVQRVVENSFYDVHNGFATVLLRFGLVGALIYVYLFSKSIPKSSPWQFAVFSSAVFVNVFLSHGPVQTVEILGLVLGLRLVQYRHRFDCVRQQVLVKRQGP